MTDLLPLSLSSPYNIRHMAAAITLILATVMVAIRWHIASATQHQRDAVRCSFVCSLGRWPTAVLGPIRNTAQLPRCDTVRPKYALLPRLRDGDAH